MKEVLEELVPAVKKSAKTAFLGVGSPLKSDDNAGNRIVALLEERLPAGPEREYRFYQGESAPENFTGAIRAFNPECLLIFDAAELKKTPGSFALIAPEKIDGIGFASHVLPLKIICNYLSSAVDGRIFLIGVQPQTLEFGENLSPAVAGAIAEFTARFGALLG